MGLVSIAGESEMNSSFYIKFRSIADEISSLAKDLNFELEGEFNSYFIEYSLRGQIDDLIFDIKSSKKQKSSFTGVIPSDAVYEEISDFKIKLNKGGFKHFIIERDGILSNIVGIFKKGETERISDKYLVRSENRNIINILISLRKGLNCILSKRLSQMKITKSREMRIDFFSFFSTRKELIEIIEIIQKFKLHLG